MSKHLSIGGTAYYVVDANDVYWTEATDEFVTVSGTIESMIDEDGDMEFRPDATEEVITVNQMDIFANEDDAIADMDMRNSEL